LDDREEWPLSSLQENTVNAIHVWKHIDSDLVNAIPELRDLLGQDAEIIVRPEGMDDEEEPLETLETFLGDALHRPPPSLEEMEALREAAKHNPGLAAALRMSERGGLDVDTIVSIRANSRS
jgi:hypothetical protein